MTYRHLAWAVVDTLKISVPTLADSLLGRLDPGTSDERLSWWARATLERAKVSITVEGGQHANTDDALVMMSNHRSLYDIPVLFTALARRVRMVAKKELFRVPIWSKAMRVAGFVELDRSDKESALMSLESAKKALDAGVSIWISPEGTRGDGRQLGPFKRGGFHLARDTRSRILPVGISGTERILPARGSRVCDGQTVLVTISPPVDPDTYTDIEQLMDRVRADILRCT